MRVMYLTNSRAVNQNELPLYMKTFGDEIIVKTSKFDLEYIKNESIDFIVSDKTQFLILPDIINFLPKKIVNLHPSFLPWGRGYNPNFWSIRLGFPHGVSLHIIDEGIDSGEIIAQTRLSYSESDTLKETYDRLRVHMINLFKVCWPELRLGKLQGFSQDKNSGNIFYKKDLENIFDKLPNKWDTTVSECQKHLDL